MKEKISNNIQIKNKRATFDYELLDTFTVSYTHLFQILLPFKYTLPYLVHQISPEVKTTERGHQDVYKRQLTSL